MEAYKPYGRNPYGRNMGQFGNNNRQTLQRNINTGSNPGCNTCSPVGKAPMPSTSECGCKDGNTHMRHMPLAMGYVPMQSWGELYDPETAICQGTAFPELNLIFCGARGKM